MDPRPSRFQDASSFLFIIIDFGPPKNSFSNIFKDNFNSDNSD